MLIPDCKKFTGYKPCEPYTLCGGDCGKYPYGAKVVIVNLGAMGAVLMSTTILPALKRKYPVSTIYWVTEERHMPLLLNNPFVDFVMPFNFRTVAVMREMKFDVICNVDKIPEACAFVNSLSAGSKLGFGLHENGVVVPLNEGSEYNYRLGLDDELKFRINTKTQPEMLREMFELDREPDSYVLHVTPEEAAIKDRFIAGHGLRPPVIGINTGSSNAFPNKRFSENHIIEMVDILFETGGGRPVILVGGLEDVERNRRYAGLLPGKVINTPADEGLRRGIAYLNICDIVVTGDTLGMHMAIGLGKQVVAWFNVTCPAEIELFGRGIKVVSEVSCSPCWKKVCDKNLVCLDEPVPKRVNEAVGEILRRHFAIRP